MQQGKNEEALKFLESVAAADPARRGVVRQIGIVYYRKNDFVKAAASFKKALEEDPGDHEAVQLLGLSYYLAGRPAEAIGPLEKVRTWYPSANVDASYISRDLLHPNEGLSERTQSLCEDVCRAWRIGRQLPLHGTDAVPARL